VFLFGTDVQFYILIFQMFIVRSDQGGSRNLFSTKVNMQIKIKINLLMLLLFLMTKGLVLTKVHNTKETT